MNKKYIIIGVSILLLSVIVGGYYYYYPTNEIQDIEIKVNKNTVSFSDSSLTGKKYDYYQVYLYPENYEITCEISDTTKQNICDTIQKNKNIFKTNSIGFFGHDIGKGSVGNVDIKTDFGDTDIDDGLLKQIFLQLYIGDIPFQSKNTELQKYFEYKKESQGNGEILINDMERMCAENIINSIPTGTFDMENTIQNRIKSECAGFQGFTPLDNEFGGLQEADKDTKINLSIKIKDLKVVYKFFEKNGKDFVEKHKDDKIVPVDIRTTQNFTMKDFMRK